jgi:rubredoxin
MFRKNHLVKINLPGGIIAAGDLYTIVEAADRARVSECCFGARQQLYCKVGDAYSEAFFRELEQAGIFYESGSDLHPNIISSYVTEAVFSRSAWVSEGLYKDILGGFDFCPRLKINLVESSQSLIPFFTGHLNFISSAINNHWHLYIRRPGTNDLYAWKAAIYSPDIPRISKLIEDYFMGGGAPSGGAWGEQLYAAIQSIFPEAPVPPPLELAPFTVPYYEGFNRYGNKSWLGIYRREELFPLDFLKAVCIVCLRTKIGQLYTTPWKSLLVKGIEDQDLPLWEFALGRHRINVRHASGELNWQMEDFCPEGLRLKRYLVRQFDQDDIRTEGLTFAIKTRKGSGLSGSIIIRKQEGIRPGQLKLLDRYEIQHTQGFDPHSKEYIVFRKDLEKENLFPYLVSLCKEFYRLQNEKASFPMGANVLSGVVSPPSERQLFRCSHCLTCYDGQYGDPEGGIAAGTSFESIASTYSCGVCGAPGTDYIPIEKSPVTVVPL